jgi:hypothetical protein
MGLVLPPLGALWTVLRVAIAERVAIHLMNISALANTLVDFVPAALTCPDITQDK